VLQVGDVLQRAPLPPRLRFGRERAHRQRRPLPAADGGEQRELAPGQGVGEPEPAQHDTGVEVGREGCLGDPVAEVTHAPLLDRLARRLQHGLGDLGER
jgi:hypothetical protein